MIRRRFYLYSSAFVFVACDSPSEQAQHPVMVHVDVQQWATVSPALLDSVVVTASNGGTVTRRAQKFNRAQTSYSFDLMLAGGSATITAEVTNSAQRALLRGSTTIFASGSATVQMEVAPAAPIPVIAPDSITLINGGTGPLRITNRGVGALTWSISGNPAGVTITPATGSLAENATAEVAIGTNVSGATRFLLDLNSEAGTLRIPVEIHTATTPLPTAVISSITTLAGQAVDVHNVRGEINVNVVYETPPPPPVDNLLVMIDNATVCSQPITSAGSQGTFVCRINTAETNPGTGSLRFPNGPRTLMVRLVGGSLVYSSTSTQLVFNN